MTKDVRNYECKVDKLTSTYLINLNAYLTTKIYIIKIKYLLA